MEAVVPLKSAVLQCASSASAAAVRPETRHHRSLFRFQQRRGKLDLRKIAAVDVDAIIREVDVETLQGVLENITFADICEDEVRCMADPVLAKVFKITQLIVEYLLHVQHTLGAGLTELVAKYQQKKKLLAEKQAVVDELQRCQRELQDEVRRQRQTISTLEHMLRVAARKRTELVAAREQQQQQEQLQQSTTTAQPTPVSSSSFPTSAETPLSTLRVSVATPDGTVLAVPVSVTQTVQELLYITAAQLQLDSVQQLRLLFRGAQLPSHLRLTNCGISDGDQLTAVVATTPVPHVPAVAPRTEDKGTQDVVAMMQQTLEQNKAMMESAVRLIARLYEQKQAAEHEPSNTALLHDEIRLLKNQLELRTNMMHERVQSLSEALVSQAAAPPRAVATASRAGELEDDIDVLTPRFRPVPDSTVMQEFPPRRKPLLRRAKPAATRAQTNDEPTTPRQEHSPPRKEFSDPGTPLKPQAELAEQPGTFDSPMPYLRQSTGNMVQTAPPNTVTTEVPSDPAPEEVGSSAIEPPVESPPPAELRGHSERNDNVDGDDDDDEDEQSKVEENSDSAALVPVEAAEYPTEETTDQPEGSPSSNRSAELRPDATADSFCQPPSLQHTFDKTMSSLGNATTSIALDATANTDISVPDDTEVAKRADEYERSAAATTAAAAALATTTHSGDYEGEADGESERLPEADAKPESSEPIGDNSLDFSESSGTVALLNASFLSASNVSSEEKR